MDAEAMDNSAYAKRYGAWAGFPMGHAPDYTRCCESVSDGRFSKQCERARGYGPGKAYCKQHDPDARKAKADARRAKLTAKMAEIEGAAIERRRVESLRAACVQAIRDIAAGHNDPRGLAAQVLSDNGGPTHDPPRSRQ